MKAMPEIDPRWVPGGLIPARHRRLRPQRDPRRRCGDFFEVDAEFVAGRRWRSWHGRGAISPARVQQAIKDLGIDPEKADPLTM